jgi:multidrug transporter EmrE-like cation transporter
MGGANFLQTHFILKSLNYFEGFVVFPVTSAGGLVLTTLVATGMLGERLTGKSKFGIVLASLALVLLHWVPSEMIVTPSVSRLP